MKCTRAREEKVREVVRKIFLVILIIALATMAVMFWVETLTLVVLMGIFVFLVTFLAWIGGDLSLCEGGSKDE